MPYSDPKGGTCREFHGIYTVMEPGDAGLYRSLLPKAFAMPTQPAVDVYVFSFDQVAAWPLGTYSEGSVRLRCCYQGEEGWFAQTMPVTSWLANLAGRWTGFPKYVADQITVQTSPPCWTGEVKHKGIIQLRLEFVSGLTRELTTWEQTIWHEALAFGTTPTYVLAPPDKGPTIQRTRLEAVVPGRWELQENGWVDVRVNPAASWAGLVSQGQRFPGMIVHWKGGLNLVVEKLR